MDIAIIGAGMAGLTCARELSRAGHAVTLFDKGRGPGGRMSTRRAVTVIGEVRFDHGAQVFTPRHADFAHQVNEWTEAGAAALWEANFVSVSADGDLRPTDDKTRYVGAPSMNAIIRHMATDMNVAWGTRVASIEGKAKAWSLLTEPGDRKGTFDAVLVAVPVEQAPDLLSGCAPAYAEIANAVVSDPCWTIMLAFDEPFEAPYDAACFETGPVAWAARNASKPGRGPEETWVLQASADWSRTHLEDDAEAVCAALIDAFAPPCDPIHAAAHRWRYSQVTAPAGEAPALWDQDTGIGVCGDWLCGRQIEDAWTSGRGLAAAIMG